MSPWLEKKTKIVTGHTERFRQMFPTWMYQIVQIKKQFSSSYEYSWYDLAMQHLF